MPVSPSLGLSRADRSAPLGPVSPEGKAASSRNALTHGLTSRTIVMPGEDRSVYEAFREQLLLEMKPAGLLQEALVQRISELLWKLRRIGLIESDMLLNHFCSVRPDPDQSITLASACADAIGLEQDGPLLRLQRYETRLERSLQACLKELRLLKKSEGDSLSGSICTEETKQEPAAQAELTPEPMQPRQNGSSFCTGAAPSPTPRANPLKPGSLCIPPARITALQNLELETEAEIEAVLNGSG